MSACYNVNMLKVSVLIPIWNVEKYIERCLRSVFGQTAADRAEFILVDDCSPDNSMKVAETVSATKPTAGLRRQESALFLRRKESISSMLIPTIGWSRTIWKNF